MIWHFYNAEAWKYFNVCTKENVLNNFKHLCNNTVIVGIYSGTLQHVSLHVMNFLFYSSLEQQLKQLQVIPHRAIISA